MLYYEVYKKHSQMEKREHFITRATAVFIRPVFIRPLWLVCFYVQVDTLTSVDFTVNSNVLST